MLPSRSIPVPLSFGPRSENTELIADDGSGVPDLCRGCENCAKDRAEYDDESAEVVPLARPSTMVKLPVLEWALLSLAPLAELTPIDSGGGFPCGMASASDGVVLLPIGVARRSCGSARREAGRRAGRGCGISGTLALLLTGLWSAEGGIARPRRGVRGPPLLRFAPGMGGRRRGTGDDMVSGLPIMSAVCSGIHELWLYTLHLESARRPMLSQQFAYISRWGIGESYQESPTISADPMRAALKLPPPLAEGFINERGQMWP